ncbi:MAG TPA: antitoxin [Polyangia bacterium]|nr:antitoxin [Polyangia bacterium]
MSMRLQVVVDEREYRAIQRAARSERVTVSEWVRRTLRGARLRQPEGDEGRKLAAIRAAARHAFPAPDIEQMLTEIESGYAAETPG